MLWVAIVLYVCIGASLGVLDAVSRQREVSSFAQTLVHFVSYAVFWPMHVYFEILGGEDGS